MSNQFTKEWCRLTWQVLLYLETVYEYLDKQGIVNVRNVNWYAGTDVEEEAHISFEVKLASVKRIQGNHLWVGLWFKKDGIMNDRPLWIGVLRTDKKLWQGLKGEFQDGLVLETNKSLEVGLEWLTPENATNDEIRAAARTLGDRITKVLIPLGAA